METEQKQSTESEQSERLQQNVEDTIPASRELKSRVKEKMIEYYAGDARRIHHFLKVHSFAKLIGEMEGVTGEERGDQSGKRLYQYRPLWCGFP